MIEYSFSQFLKTNNLGLIFFVSFGLFIFENGLTQKLWTRDFVIAEFIRSQKSIGITTGVYDYSFGPYSEHGYLSHCEFEASVDNSNYFRLMEIETSKQNKSNSTNVFFKNKASMAKIIFLNDIHYSQNKIIWSNLLRKRFQITVTNDENIAAVVLKWDLERKYRDVCYIRIKGKWQVDGQYTQIFSDVVYDLNEKRNHTTNSTTSISITKKFKNKGVNIVKNSESIIIKGVEVGSNVKVYSTLGIEIR